VTAPKLPDFYTQVRRITLANQFQRCDFGHTTDRICWRTNFFNAQIEKKRRRKGTERKRKGNPGKKKNQVMGREDEEETEEKRKLDQDVINAHQNDNI
jgi:hypothetical protein